jgi:transposase
LDRRCDPTGHAAHRRAMERCRVANPISESTQGRSRPTTSCSTPCARRDALDFVDRRALEIAAGRVSAVPDRPSPNAGVGSSSCVLENPASNRRGPQRPRQARSDRDLHRRHPRRGQKGGALVGVTRRGLATKIMAVADGHGFPIAVGIASGPRHEAKLVIETIGQRFVRSQLLRLIGDRAYDSTPLENELAERGIRLIAPTRKKAVVRPRPRRKADGREMRRYRRRWLVERFFAWLMRWRRIVTRYERKADNFLAFVQFACAIILMRRF